MAHVFDLALDQKEELVSSGLARIKPKAVLTANMLGAAGSNANGSTDFLGQYQEKSLDISCGILNKHIVIKSQVPVLPTKSGVSNQKGHVTLQIDNAIKYLSSIQEEAILDYYTIQDAEIELHAQAGSMTDLPVYKGRVISQPTEEEGKTTLQIRSIIWDIIDVEVKHERSTSGLITPSLFFDTAGNFLNVTPYVSGGVTYYHGLGVFDEYGNIRTSIINEDSDRVELYRIDFFENSGEAPMLGKYTIEFTSNAEFTLTQPDRITFYGNRNTNFSQGFVSILAASWNVLGADLTGAKIEFFCYYTVSGNPISIVKNLIYKSLTGSWGETSSNDPALAVDWAALDQLETLYAGTRVFISETNKDNAVFSPQNQEKPFRIRDFVQKILDHIGCQIIFDSQGRVTVRSSYYQLPGEETHTIESCHLSSGAERKPSHKIISGGQKYDYLRIRYGYNDMSGNYGSTAVYIDGTKDKYNILEISYDYFKTGLNKANAEGQDCKVWWTVRHSDIRLEMNMLPNWGLPVEVGDKFAVDLECQPVLPNTRTGLGEFWEVYEVSKKIGGIVNVKCKMIQEPFDAGRLCEMILCTDKLG